MPLSQALPPYTSIPISHLERSIEGAITLPMHPTSRTSKATSQTAHHAPSVAAGDPLEGEQSPSELHQASVDHARTLIQMFHQEAEGFTFVERTMGSISDVMIGHRHIRQEEICLLEIHQHGQRAQPPRFILAANTQFLINETLLDLAFTKMVYILCDEIEVGIPRGFQCFGIVIIGTKIKFHSITPAKDHPGCFVSALEPARSGESGHDGYGASLRATEAAEMMLLPGDTSEETNVDGSSIQLSRVP